MNITGTTQETGDLARLKRALVARAVIEEWTQGAGLLALLSAADRSGWLRRLREPATAADLAAAGLTAARVPDVLPVLEAARVVTGQDGCWQLTPDFAALVTGASGVRIGTVLEAIWRRIRLVEEAAGADAADRWSAADAMAVAFDAGVDVDSGSQGLVRLVYGAIRPFWDRLAAGGPLLDLGCGIGGTVLTSASLFGNLRAVGVEIVPEVAAEAARRCAALGLSDRVEIRCLDARDLDAVSAFGVAFWAQSSFPAGTRAQTLAVAHRALHPGGLLLIQEIVPPFDDPSAPSSRELLERLPYRQREIPCLSAEQLAQEAEDAGFTLAEITPTPLGRYVLTQRPDKDTP